MSNNIKTSINKFQIKKICANRKNAEIILNRLGVIHCKKNTTEEIYELILKNWDYTKVLGIVRNIFKLTEKYKNGREALSKIEEIKTFWREKNLGNFKWPCSQGQWENHAQMINHSKKSLEEKMKQTQDDSVKYGLMKSFNTNRNDYIEFLMFEYNESILPTLSHNRGLDFFIDGVEYDQKVAKSPTDKFKKDYGKNWLETAIKNPELVAKYLYENQDEERFDCKNRLYVVSLTDEINYEKLKETIENIDFSKPFEVSFNYNHKTGGLRQYKSSCFVVLSYI